MSENKWTSVPVRDCKVFQCSNNHYVVTTRDFLRVQALAGEDMDSIPCPVCAEIKVAIEGNLKDQLACLEMARKEGREEVLKMAMEEVAEEDSLIGDHILESYQERFGS